MSRAMAPASCGTTTTMDDTYAFTDRWVLCQHLVIGMSIGALDQGECRPPINSMGLWPEAQLLLSSLGV